MKKRGFTLVELMVVVSIIGILATIITTSLGTAKASGRDAKRVSDVKNIQLSLGLYYNDNLHYPCKLDTSAATGCAPAFVPGYMTTVPVDPLSQTAYPYVALVPGTINGASCGSASASNVSAYHLGAGIENTGASYMNQDNDAFIAASGNNSLAGTGVGVNYNGTSVVACSSSQTNINFNGNNGGCTGTSAGGGSDGCYDVYPY